MDVQICIPLYRQRLHVSRSLPINNWGDARSHHGFKRCGRPERTEDLKTCSHTMFIHLVDSRSLCRSFTLSFSQLVVHSPCRSFSFSLDATQHILKYFTNMLEILHEHSCNVLLVVHPPYRSFAVSFFHLVFFSACGSFTLSLFQFFA